MSLLPSTLQRALVHTALAWLALALAGCAQAECPELASECAASCNALTAQRFDAERGCRELSATIIGCAAPDLQSSDAACFRRVSDDSVWIGSSSALPRPAFERCEGTLLTQVVEAPACE